MINKFPSPNRKDTKKLFLTIKLFQKTKSIKRKIKGNVEEKNFSKVIGIWKKNAKNYFFKIWLEFSLIEITRNFLFYSFTIATNNFVKIIHFVHFLWSLKEKTIHLF